MVAQNMLDVVADDLSDFVFSVFPLFSFPAVPPTGSAPSRDPSFGDPSSGEPSDFGDEAIDEVISVSKVLTEAVEVGTKSLAGVVVVD